MSAEPAARRHRARRGKTVRLGNRSATIHGLAAAPWRDVSHLALTVSWPVFVAGSAVAFVVLNTLFAALFALSPGSVANVPDGSPFYYLYFSIETIATVGYGDMHPQSHYGHLVASLEMFVGIFYAAVLTGLVFSRFARPQARILFARTVTITRHDGQPTLMVRMANERHNAISSATAKLWYLRREVSAEARQSRTFTELPLRRSESPAFVLSWTIFHVIDAASPLHGLTIDDLTALDIAFTLIVEGYDESASQIVRARHNYGIDDLMMGERYVDILEQSDARSLRVDYGRFHETVPDDS